MQCMNRCIGGTWGIELQRTTTSYDVWEQEQSSEKENVKGLDFKSLNLCPVNSYVAGVSARLSLLGDSYLN